MMRRLRTWIRDQYRLSRAVRRENPRGLTRRQYVAAEAEQLAALRSAVVAFTPGPDLLAARRARAEAARAEHYAPELTRDQQAALLERETVKRQLLDFGA